MNDTHLQPLRSRDIIAKFKRLGFVESRISGSHVILVKDNITLTIPQHNSRTIRFGTLRDLIKRANVTIKEFNNA